MGSDDGSLIAEVELTEEPEFGIRRDALGIHSLGRLEYELRDGGGLRGPTGTGGLGGQFSTGLDTPRLPWED